MAICLELSTFADAKSLREVLSGSSYYICIKPSCLDMPILLFDDDMASAMREASLKAFPSEVALATGIVIRLTMYSFRRYRLTFTQLIRGTEAARNVASHVPDTSSIYAHCSDVRNQDLTEMVLNGVEWNGR